LPVSSTAASIEIEVSVPSPADTTPPTPPSDLRAKVVKGRKVALTSSAATDDVGVESYRVLRNGSASQTVGGSSYTETVTGKGTTYVVVAVDAAGNASSPSNSVTLR